ncbi:MAG: DUF3857 domain-containing protein [Paludibacter sp.]|nr:DUF3857 domain-containing protein [Paludibacter sp.]
MRRICVILSLSIYLASNLLSQEFSYKYGKITNDELKMTVYAKDTTAAAVVIYDDGYTAYNILSNKFQMQTDYKKKIKILKQKGVDEANFEIPYYYKSQSEREMIISLEAVAYNLENGKVVKTKLEKKYIFDEELSNRYRRIKFSVPNVKVGTVIEVKFSNSTNLVYSINPWKIQGDIPVIYSFYEVKIPEYFKFNIQTKGFEHIKVSETEESQQFTVGSGSDGLNIVHCTSRNIKFTAKDVPALKDEVYVWCVNDFLSGVRFELKATNFPYEYYKPYSQTWDDLENNLKKDTDFGTNLKMTNPYKNEIKALISSVTDEKEKIEKIYGFFKENIRWNEKYSFWGNKAKDLPKERTGDNGQINMLLLSALKEAKINAYPVLISRRSTGRLPYGFPSLDQLNTFIVAAKTYDNKTYYMDGSATNGGLNMLPVDFLVDRARVYNETEHEKWVDLTQISQNKEMAVLQVNMNKEGNLSGQRSTIYTYQNAIAYKNKFQAAKDSAEFVEKFENENNINVSDMKIEGKEPMSNAVKEEINFTKTFENTGGFIYLNPMIFTHIETNKFTQTDRKLPIEFNYPNSYSLNCTITLPDNYQVVEIPKSLKISLNENCNCTYLVKQEGNKLLVNYRFELNQIIFPFSDYNAIRDYFGQVVTKNHEMVVLKKI